MNHLPEIVHVSDKKIVKIKIEEDKIPSKGSDWFENPYSNIFVLGKTASGKTNVILNIVNRMAGKNTKFILFISTKDIDPKWVKFIKKLEDNGHSVIAETSFFEDIPNSNKKINMISEFISDRDNGNSDKAYDVVVNRSKNPINNNIIKPSIISKVPMFHKQIDRAHQTIKQGNTFSSEVDGVIKKQNPRLIYPDYILIFDDQGKALRNHYVEELLKKCRHYKLMCILSSQSLTDLTPSSLAQLSYVLVFDKLSEDKLDDLRNNLNLKLTYSQLETIYKDATRKTYSFLYIDRLNGEHYRKNFNDEYQI